MAKSRISRIIVILAIIALIGPGVRIIKHSLSDRPSIEAQDARSAGKAVKLVSFSNPKRELSDYQMVAKNDLFKPLGWQKAVIVTTTSPPQQIVQEGRQQPPPEPLSRLSFTGIVQLGSEYVALVEDSSKGKAYFLRKGDRLKNFVVEAITEESLVLSNESSKLTPHIGSTVYYNSEGLITTSEPYSSLTMARTSESGVEERVSLNESSDNMSVIERMRARRRRELGQ